MKQADRTTTELGLIAWANLALIGVCIIALFYYVAIANSISGKNYKIQGLRINLGVLTEINGTLVSQKMSLENVVVLRNLAKSLNLVEAKNISYIFENKNMAQR